MQTKKSKRILPRSAVLTLLLLVAAGLSIGACSHAVGTARALELGETQGAMSGLAIGICGIVTVILSVVLM